MALTGTSAEASDDRDVGPAAGSPTRTNFEQTTRELSGERAKALVSASGCPRYRALRAARSVGRRVEPRQATVAPAVPCGGRRFLLLHVEEADHDRHRYRSHPHALTHDNSRTKGSSMSQQAAAPDEIQVSTDNQAEYELARMRHSAAHVLAEAVMDMFPDAKLAIGPAIDSGFYYDFDLPRALTPDDLEEIESRMAAHIAAHEPFERREVTRDEAMKLFADQPYKLELIRDLSEHEVISTFQNGPFLDLCRGPTRVPSAPTS
jgi:hypothetical protein